MLEIIDKSYQKNIFLKIVILSQNLCFSVEMSTGQCLDDKLALLYLKLHCIGRSFIEQSNISMVCFTDTGVVFQIGTND